MTGSNRQVTLRRARPADTAELAEIWYRGWCDGHLGHVSDQLVAVRTPQSFQTRAADRIGDTTVAVVDGTVAGFVMVAGDEVEQVYVSTGHRGTGVADALMREAERLVRVNGHTRAWLAVVAGNARARRFYERCGWLDDGAFEYSAYSEEGPISVPSHRYVKEI
ncbi:MAG: GNAT family N-acetyltransferase [Vicinamibacteraceae bacterium]